MNAIDANQRIEFFNEYRENFYDAGGLAPLEDGLYNSGYNTDRFPMSFSLKASPT